MTSIASKAYNNKGGGAFSSKISIVKFRRLISNLQNTFRQWSYILFSLLKTFNIYFRMVACWFLK